MLLTSLLFLEWNNCNVTPFLPRGLIQFIFLSDASKHWSLQEIPKNHLLQTGFKSVTVTFGSDSWDVTSENVQKIGSDIFRPLTTTGKCPEYSVEGWHLGRSCRRQDVQIPPTIFPSWQLCLCLFHPEIFVFFHSACLHLTACLTADQVSLWPFPCYWSQTIRIICKHETDSRMILSHREHTYTLPILLHILTLGNRILSRQPPLTEHYVAWKANYISDVLYIIFTLVCTYTIITTEMKNSSTLLLFGEIVVVCYR